MADVSQLGLDSPDPIDYDQYDEGGGSAATLPPTLDEEGNNIIFTLEVGEKIAFSRAQSSGKLMATIDTMKVVEPEGGGEVRFTRASSKQFERKGKPINASQMGNFLRSAGIELPRNPTNQDLADACEAAKGALVRAVCDWRAYDKETRTTYEGYTNFPLREDGSRTPGLRPGTVFAEKDWKGTVTLKDVKNPLRANLQVRWFVTRSA